jgi:hypothetical protein
MTCPDNNFGYYPIQEYRVSQAQCLVALVESFCFSIPVRDGLAETRSCVYST